MIDRTKCNERKETLYTSSPRRDTTSTNYDSTSPRYETSGARYDTLTEKRSDSVIKGVIALLSLLALLWLAYSIISSTMHRSHTRVNEDAIMNSPRIEDSVTPDSSLGTKRIPDVVETSPSTSTVTPSTSTTITPSTSTTNTGATSTTGTGSL